MYKPHVRILFFSYQFGYRGTEVALFDYAKYTRDILGCEVAVSAPRNAPHNHPLAIQKFEREFEVRWVESNEHLDAEAKAFQADVVYATKSGHMDGMNIANARYCVHAVFEKCFHGDRIAYISDWLAGFCEGPAVNYIVDVAPPLGNLRSELGIPDDAIVIGRHGGADTFDCLEAREAVKRVLDDPQRHFIFMGTDPFCEPHERIRHLPVVSDRQFTRAFVDTCDAMIHGRYRGETFGLACAEFGAAGKPVLAWSESPERAHYDVLGSLCRPYKTADDCEALLRDVQRLQTPLPSNICERFSPQNVMEQFRQVFLL